MLTGVYVHGSFAMGCFNPAKSDLDVLVVVEDAITDLQKKMFMDEIIFLNNKLPPKGIEISVVRSEYCKNFVYPTPYELHFSNMHLSWYMSNPAEYIRKMNGTDNDLAAHFFITKRRGMVLYGKKIDDVFGDVPHEAYLDSIRRDIMNSHVEVMENPVYFILNLCRVLAYVQEALVLSKKEGGEWALKNIHCEKYHGLINEALICYGSDKTMDPDESLAVDFCEYMKNVIG